METDKTTTAITKFKSNWLWRLGNSEELPAELPHSKTERLSLQAKLANVEAENAFERAYQAELMRTQAVGEAMFKSGKALRYSLISSGRQILVRVESARRRFEPGYRRLL